MGETRIPEQVTVWCDRCKKEPSEKARKKGWVDARIELMDRDFGGGIVYSRKYEICQSCRRSLAEWLVEDTDGT